MVRRPLCNNLVLYIYETVHCFAYMIRPPKLFLFECLIIQGHEEGTVGKRDIKRGVVAVRWESFPSPVLINFQVGLWQLWHL